MIRKQGNMGKEWEIEVKEQNQEPESLSVNTLEKLSDHQTCRVTRVSQKEMAGPSLSTLKHRWGRQQKILEGCSPLCMERTGGGGECPQRDKISASALS